MNRFARFWLSAWLYFMVLASGVIVGITISKWDLWGLQEKLFAAATALLPFHVLEEWYFPGDFHTMYNLMARSNCPDRYPMNQMSDMFTNLIGMVFGCLVLIVGVSPFFCVMQLFLCCAEVFGHFSGGIFLYRKFKYCGKRTIYSPGMATTVFGYIPIGVGIIVSFVTQTAPTALQFILAAASGVALGGAALNLPEKLFKRENTPYGYTWGGYLNKFSREEKDVPHRQR